MSYNEGKIWDSKRGWVTPHRGITIRRIKPVNPVTVQDYDDYLNAPDNPDYTLWSKELDKIGYTEKNCPIAREERFEKKLERFEKINNWLNRLPFVRVIVLDKENTSKNPFTRRD
jgi:hypothetical protein